MNCLQIPLNTLCNSLKSDGLEIIQKTMKSLESKIPVAALEKFGQEIEKEYEEKEVPGHILNILVVFLHMEQEYVTTSLRLLLRLGIDFEDYVEMSDLIKDLEKDFPLAKQVMEKIDSMMQNFEVVDEDMEFDMEDEEEEC